jgi:hypothetical protein
MTGRESASMTALLADADSTAGPAVLADDGDAVGDAAREADALGFAA